MGVDQVDTDTTTPQRTRYADDEDLLFGDDDDYRVRYDSTAGEWVYESKDVDGQGTTGPVMKWQDGDDTAYYPGGTGYPSPGNAPVYKAYYDSNNSQWVVESSDIDGQGTTGNVMVADDGDQTMFFPGAAGFPSPGNSPVYRSYYDSQAGQWVLESTDVDGTGTTGNVMVVGDGDNTVFYPGPVETGEFGSFGFRDGGVGAVNVLYQSGTPRIAKVRNFADNPTLWELRSKAGDTTADDREATLALVRTDDAGQVETLDVYNNGYHSSADDIAVAAGMRFIKNGGGVFRDIYTDYYDQGADTRTPIRRVVNPDDVNGPYINYRQTVRIGAINNPSPGGDLEIETAVPTQYFTQQGTGRDHGLRHESYSLTDQSTANLNSSSSFLLVTVNAPNTPSTFTGAFVTDLDEQTSTVVIDPNGDFTAVKDTQGTVNIFYDSGVGGFVLENEYGEAITAKVLHIGTLN